MTYNLYENMMYNLPAYYQESKVVTNLMREEARELGDMSLALQDLLNQMFISKATWGLELWEKSVGVKTDLALSYEDRRSIIMAKLRGTGTVTKEMIATVAEAFLRGKVIVHEIPENLEINIEFTDDTGVPPRLEELKAAIREIIPCHLQLTFTYNWLTFQELNDLLWSDIEGKTWSELEQLK